MAAIRGRNMHEHKKLCVAQVVESKFVWTVTACLGPLCMVTRGWSLPTDKLINVTLQGVLCVGDAVCYSACVLPHITLSSTAE